MKLYIFGHTHLKGVSKKTGNEYDFYQVEVLSRRNSGDGSPLMASVMAIQAPAFDKILAPALPDLKQYPVLVSAEFDNRGTLVEAALVKSGKDVVKDLTEAL